jgi:phosphoribosylamine--glycine ligase/phosphoribosylformylglycinamidine cyclo-ligase
MVSKNIFEAVRWHSYTKLSHTAHYYILGGILCFAPTERAAELEGSKAFAKDFMQRHHIPTARGQVFTSFMAARNHLLQATYPVVIKASGLAARRAVILSSTIDEALQAVEDILLRLKFGTAGFSIVIEEYLEGPEISVLTLSDGSFNWSFPPGQDHNQASDEDPGPYTGRMGLYAPARIVTPIVMEEIKKSIIRPTFDGLRSEGSYRIHSLALLSD